jgi:hypothetical protein
MLKKILNKIFNPFMESEENYKKYIDKLLKKILKYPIISEEKFRKIFLNPSVYEYLHVNYIDLHNYNNNYYFVARVKKHWYIIPSYYKIQKFKLTKKHLALIYLYYIENNISINSSRILEIGKDKLLLRSIKIDKILNNIL